MRVFCVVAYTGTNYYGWEKQVGQNSVQAELEKAIGKNLMFGEEVVELNVQDEK